MPHSGIWLFCHTHHPWWQPVSYVGQMDTFHMVSCPHPDVCSAPLWMRLARIGEHRKGKKILKVSTNIQLCRKHSYSGGQKVHEVVWGCKHPRLEAAVPTELSVWCLLPPTASCSTATLGHRAHVSLYPILKCRCKCIQVRAHAWIPTVAALGSGVNGVSGGLDVILAISCSASVHVNILHSAVIAGSRGWEKVVYLDRLEVTLRREAACWAHQG